jgi:cyclopropane fatty-acyl-phospholipid synthase-like methyltransferase
MKTRLFLSALSLIVLLSACSETKKQNNDSNTQNEHTEKHHKNRNKHKNRHKNAANEHMHKRPVEELIQNFESPERDAYQKPELVLDYLGDITDKTIMDIGAGSGYFSVKLADKGAKVIAADVSDEFQAALKKRIETNNLENIELRKIPYDSPSLSEKEVDMVLIVNTYHHIEDRVSYFSEVKTGLKDSGELVVIDFFKKDLPVGPKPDHKIAMDVVTDELKQAGYTLVDVNVDLLPYQYIIRAR